MGNAKSKGLREERRRHKGPAQESPAKTAQPVNLPGPPAKPISPQVPTPPVPPQQPHHSAPPPLPQSHPDQHSPSFESTYLLGKRLGSGAFSVVREATKKAGGGSFAVKCIKKKGMSPEDAKGLTEEIHILKELNHPNIMKLYDVYEEPEMWYLVTEFLTGGELFDRIVEKEYYNEKEARDLIQILLSAISYCHDRKIAHRDLKPENLLLINRQDDTSIKVVDFGFAKEVELEGLSTACGTPGYVAPEILEKKRYGTECDIWSIGVITFILLCGYPPFHHDNHSVLFKLIKAGKFQFDSPYWDEVSEEAKQFIRRMLITDPSQRASAKELLEDKWITGEARTSELVGAREELKRFNAKRKFRAAVDIVTAAQRLTKGASQE